MKTPTPGASLPKRRTARRYVNAVSEQLLRDCFPGLIPATVIEDALRQKAIREGRLAAAKKPAGRGKP